MEKKNNMTARTNCEKADYTAPEMKPEILSEDVVLLSTVNEVHNLDEVAKKWDPTW